MKPYSEIIDNVHNYFVDPSSEVIFRNVNLLGAGMPTVPIGKAGGYQLDQQDPLKIVLTDDYDPIINAIDINWNEVVVGEKIVRINNTELTEVQYVTLSTTGDLIKWIKDSDAKKVDITNIIGEDEQWPNVSLLKYINDLYDNVTNDIGEIYTQIDNFSGAEENIIESISINDTEQTPINKNVNLVLALKNSKSPAEGSFASVGYVDQKISDLKGVISDQDHDTLAELLTYVNDNYSHIQSLITDYNNLTKLPAIGSQDYGKILATNSNGQLYWKTENSGGSGSSATYKITINGSTYGDENNGTNLGPTSGVFAPINRGTGGQILVASGNNTPIWKNIEQATRIFTQYGQYTELHEVESPQNGDIFIDNALFVYDGSSNDWNKCDFIPSYNTNNNGQVLTVVNGNATWEPASGKMYQLTLNSTRKGDSNGTNLGTFFAPVTFGTKGYILVSNGNGAPLWKSASSLGTPNSKYFITLNGTDEGDSDDGTNLGTIYAPTSSPYDGRLLVSVSQDAPEWVDKEDATGLYTDYGQYSDYSDFTTAKTGSVFISNSDRLIAIKGTTKWNFYNLLEFGISKPTNSDTGKVLTVNNNGGVSWQTPSSGSTNKGVQVFSDTITDNYIKEWYTYSYVDDGRGLFDQIVIDKVQKQHGVHPITAKSNLNDLIVDRTDSTIWKLDQDANDEQVWECIIKGLPQYYKSDEGKVLTISSSGQPNWQTPSSSGGSGSGIPTDSNTYYHYTDGTYSSERVQGKELFGVALITPEIKIGIYLGYNDGYFSASNYFARSAYSSKIACYSFTDGLDNYLKAVRYQSGVLGGIQQGSNSTITYVPSLHQLAMIFRYWPIIETKVNQSLNSAVTSETTEFFTSTSYNGILRDEGTEGNNLGSQYVFTLKGSSGNQSQQWPVSQYLDKALIQNNGTPRGNAKVCGGTSQDPVVQKNYILCYNL